MRRWVNAIPFLLLGVGVITLGILNANKAISDDWTWQLQKFFGLLLALSIPHSINVMCDDGRVWYTRGAEAPKGRRLRFTRAQTAYTLLTIACYGFSALLNHRILSWRSWGFVVWTLTGLIISSCFFMCREAYRYLKALEAEFGAPDKQRRSPRDGTPTGTPK